MLTRIMNLPLLREAKNLKGKKVLLRAGLNVPIKNGEIQSTFRIEKTLSTIDFLKKAGAKIILLSHHSNETQSLMPVYEYLKKIFEIRFVADIYDTDAFIFDTEDIILCENIRFWEGEKKNDPEFAKHLASLGEIYVNNAFSVSHREHASLVLLPKLLPAYAGLTLEEEIKELSRALDMHLRTFMILGGEKISTKLPIAKKLVNNVEELFIGGALSNNFFKEDGYEVGNSIYDDSVSGLSEFRKNKKVLLPIDLIVKNDEGVYVKMPSEVLSKDRISDAGPKTIKLIKERIDKADFVILNGPLGEYKKDGFEKGTLEIIRYIVEKDVVSIIGGGDTVALVYEAGVEKDIDFISTGGGAMLEFIADKTLPGIEALSTSP